MPELSIDQKRDVVRRFTMLFGIAVVVLAALPSLIAWVAAPSGSRYIGYQYNTDDHMVYAAWMRQAMDGRLLMDNRFAVDPQPGLTIHVYYFLLGLVAKITGIPIATFLARIGFGLLFVVLLGRFVGRLRPEVYTHKLALGLAVFGGGLGFLVWHNFGVAMIKPTAGDFLKSPLLSRLPTDVWQPEGYVFPSLLTNSLFMVSLCLIVYVLTAVLDARESWRPVLPAALAFAALMNIHSYDVLLVTIALTGFLAMTVAQKQATVPWVMRALAIGAGAIPPALYFVFVLKQDPVFQARAATETFSPNFRSLLFGYLPLMVLAFIGMGLREGERTRRLVGLGIVGALFAGMYIGAASHADRYFMDPSTWVVCLLVAGTGLVALSDERPAWNLVASWAILGTVAIYFPALFQRKLAMGLSIPWAILAAYGLHALLAKQERSARNLATILGLIVMGGTSLFWFKRENDLRTLDVSNTTVHPVYLPADAARILDYLNSQPGRKVVIAPPGRPGPMVDEKGNPVPDQWGSPPIPDLNPILSGFTGSYTYAGHWSETPEYGKRRGILERLYYAPDADRASLLKETGADYAVVLAPEAFPDAGLPDLGSLGERVVDGSRFRLIRIAK